MASKRTPTMIVADALQEARKANDAIRKHTIECSEKWTECNDTLKDLKSRWEKLAWMICASVLTGATAIVLKEFLT